ncbi:hypothetical protein SEA_CRICKO_49 [Streptomyces phage CricKo]|nr:hypothetical protein SEA_CRICKO_49 [Streptomyces phage CricKo]QNL30664.1 hypothetical protein SEA_THIQQUMS_49 [Streptomyces phage Thiqqums]
MCAKCALGDPKTHVDGTILDRDLNPLFEGTEDQIMDYIMRNPLVVHTVWVAGEGEPISIDEWTEWVDESETQ